MFFDVGFTEILFLAIAGLIVLGPERLPAVARTLGGWVRRGRQMASDFQRELEREVDLSEIKALKDEVDQAAQPLKEAAKTLDEGRSMLKQPLGTAAKSIMKDPKEIPETLEYHEPMPSTEPSDNVNSSDVPDVADSADSASGEAKAEEGRSGQELGDMVADGNADIRKDDREDDREDDQEDDLVEVEEKDVFENGKPSEPAAVKPTDSSD